MKTNIKKIKKFTLTKNNEKYEFNEYNDKDIGINLDAITIKPGNLEKINKIYYREDDFSSDENSIKLAENKCLSDINDTFDYINEGNIDADDIHYLHKYPNKIIFDDDISQVKENILNAPEYEIFEEK